MTFGFLFPIIQSDFSFSKLHISKGIYLIDISNKENWTNKAIKKNNNVGVLITNDIKKMDTGAADIEIAMEILLLFCFLKTKLSYSIDGCYEVIVSADKKMELITEKPINAFLEKGWAFISFYNFMFGLNRDGILSKVLFNKIKRDCKYFEKYRELIRAQLSPNIKSPLGVAMNTFMAAFANQGQDDPKYILIITALEALFSVSPSEISFRLSNSIAWFLYPKQNSYRLRKKVVNKVKKFYNIRSRLVHGAFQNILPIELGEILILFSTIIEKILEKHNISKVFLNKEKHDKFIRDLEVGYFNG